MFKHSLLLSFRTFKRYKSTFFINITGLSCGLACVLLIFLWINDELSFDKYHANDSRLYQVMTNTKSDKGVTISKSTPHTLGETVALEMPNVEHAATATPDLFLPAFTLSGSDKKVQGLGKFASRDFFKIFSYHLILGNGSNVLSNRNAIVLSQSHAKNLFGPMDNIIGKTIDWEVAGIKRQCS